MHVTTQKSDQPILLLVFTFLLCACQAVGLTAVPSTIPTRDLVLYSSPTPSLTPRLSPTERFAATLPITPSPSSTPFIHTIAKGDTLGSIALKYGVSLQDLLAANPKIDPHFLTIDTVIIIPIKENDQDPNVLSTPTPLPVQQAKPICYPTSNRGAWCFVTIGNNQAQPVENLTAWIGLFNPSGELISSQIAQAPLNLLPQGMSIPLSAYFPPPVPEKYTVRTQLITALPVTVGDPRYLQTHIELEATTISQDGKQATVMGTVVQTNKKKPARQVWLVVFAYDVDGDVVGMRRWELDRLSFKAKVFSLGPKIHRVDVLVEARP